MSKAVVSIRGKTSAPSDRFRVREFKRLLQITCRFRTTLGLGVLAMVVFAALHTVTIGGAFPIFKILLEEEGLHGWADRMVAGRRIGVDFAAPRDPRELMVIDVHASRPGHAAGLRPGSRVRDAQGATSAELLASLAGAATGKTIALQATGVQGLDPAASVELEVTPIDAPKTMRWLRQAALRLPADSTEERLYALGFLLAALLGIVVSANVFRYLGEVLIAKSILRAMMQLRAELYARTLRLPMSFFAGRRTSDMVARFVQDVAEIQRGMVTLFSKFLREPLRAVFLLGLALVLDWRITLTMLVLAPIAFFVFWRMGQRVKRANRRLLEAYGEMIGALTDALQSLRVVKAYTAEQRERDRLSDVDRRVLRQQVKLARMEAFVSPMMETIAVFAGCILTMWLAGRVLQHKLEMSNFLALGVALSMMFDPLRKLTDVYVRIQRATAGAERVFQVLDHPIEIDEPGGVELQPLQRSIEYVNVCFTYPGAETPALSDVNLSVQRGETVAIVGPNGSGKTTLVSMLLRLFDPDAGEIRYDGLDIRKASLASLRRKIGLVAQDAVIFGGTPAENIAYGFSTNARATADRSAFAASAATDGRAALPHSHELSKVDRLRVEEAARRASADEFIEALPGGYDAALGERGTTLSGGERQRLAIARAIYRDPPVLIFDEATSQVDSESERKIQAALHELARDRTTLIIAHRLSTIQFADRIIVMDAGRVIDTGPHQELFDRCPLYRTLCETQFVTEATNG